MLFFFLYYFRSTCIQNRHMELATARPGLEFRFCHNINRHWYNGFKYIHQQAAAPDLENADEAVLAITSCAVAVLQWWYWLQWPHPLASLLTSVKQSSGAVAWQRLMPIADRLQLQANLEKTSQAYFILFDGRQHTLPKLHFRQHFSRQLNQINAKVVMTRVFIQKKMNTVVTRGVNSLNIMSFRRVDKSVTLRCGTLRRARNLPPWQKCANFSANRPSTRDNFLCKKRKLRTDHAKKWEVHGKRREKAAQEVELDWMGNIQSPEDRGKCAHRAANWCSAMPS